MMHFNVFLKNDDEAPVRRAPPAGAALPLGSLSGARGSIAPRELKF
eukprot:COSAG03_NODE_1452_length_4059_cov_2.800253_3_plen_46_part_00